MDCKMCNFPQFMDLPLCLDHATRACEDMIQNDQFGGMGSMECISCGARIRTTSADAMCDGCNQL